MSNTIHNTKVIKGLKLKVVPINRVGPVGSTNYIIRNSLEPFFPVAVLGRGGALVAPSTVTFTGDSYIAPLFNFLAASPSAPVVHINDSHLRQAFDFNHRGTIPPEFCVVYIPIYEEDRTNLVVNVLTDIKSSVMGFLSTFGK